MSSANGGQAFKSSGGPWGTSQKPQAPTSYDKPFPAASKNKKSAGATTVKEDKKINKKQ